MLDYRLIEAFAAVITEKGFEKASEKLGLTQSAVSQRIKQLEELMGKILIKRTTPPEVTDEGKKLFRHFMQVDFLESEYIRTEQSENTEEYLKFPVGVNADSLGTWFLPSIGGFARKNHLTLEIITADQSETDLLLKSGDVLGCISSSEKSIQGCRKEYLGMMRYIAVASPVFYNMYFRNGFNSEAVSAAPSVYFNRSDNLLKQFLSDKITADLKNIAINYIPSYETFIQAIMMDLGYGIVPEIQAQKYLAEKKLLNIYPDHYINLKLYWHCWNIDSLLIRTFTDNLIKKSAAYLKKH
jgi:LysR family transcriptional regulator (chromosome initiation inhibitor)